MLKAGRLVLRVVAVACVALAVALAAFWPVSYRRGDFVYADAGDGLLLAAVYCSPGERGHASS